MARVTWTALTYFVLAEMTGDDLFERFRRFHRESGCQPLPKPDCVLCEVEGALVEDVLRAFARLTHGARDPDCYLINSFHDLAEKEATRVKRRPDHRSRPARDPRKGRPA